jgi:signal transduction histidine kinase/CheY-like chemotaxis protein
MSKSTFYALISLLFLAGCFGGGNSFSQNTANTVNEDSLKEAVNKTAGLSKVKAIKKLIHYYGDKDLNGMKMYVDKYISQPDSIVSTVEKRRFLKELSKIFASYNDYKTSYYLLQKADSLINKNDYIPAKSETLKMYVTNNDRKNIAFYFFVATLMFFVAALVFFIWTNQKRKVEINNYKNIKKALLSELDKKKAELEERVEKKTQELKKQVDELAEKETALKTELKRAEEANYLKNAFLANIGFDIRTPLNSIIGFANLLETELAVRKSKELYNYADNIEQSGYFLLKMLDNVIDISALEANKLELKIAPVDLSTIINAISPAYSLKAKEKNLIFKTKVDDELPPVLADKNGLKKVLKQIIDNAFQFTSEGFVTVSCSYDESHDLAVIEVKDTGIGMDELLQENIRKTINGITGENYSQGAGVGLKLAKKYMEIMNGQLLINSSPGEGTTVTIQVPCSKTSEIVVLKEGDEPVASDGVQVTATLHDLGKLDFFVVEDDRMNRMIIEKILSKEGTVTLAVDGDDCMDIVSSEASKGHYFQVMLFDINLPEPWDGVKLMKEIRKKYPKYRKIPFIAQTAYAMAGDKERFLKEGFDSYVSKPIDKNELIGVVRQQLELFGNRKTK